MIWFYRWPPLLHFGLAFGLLMPPVYFAKMVHLPVGLMFTMSLMTCLGIKCALAFCKRVFGFARTFFA